MNRPEEQPRSQETRVYIKTRDKERYLLNGLKDPEVIMPPVSTQPTDSFRAKSSTKKTLSHFLDAVKEYEFKRVFQVGKGTDRDKVIRWGLSNSAISKRKSPSLRQPKHLKGLMISLVGAVLIGTVMGFSALTLFSSEESARSTYMSTNAIQESQLGDNQQSLMKLPEWNVTLLQAGSFADQASASKVAEGYKKAGLSPAISKESPYRVYVGVGSTLDEASRLSGLYSKLQESEFYLRNVSISPKGVVGGKEIQLLSQIMRMGHALATQLITVSIQALSTKSSSSLPASFAEQHREFIAQSQKVIPSLPADVKGEVEKMVKSLNEAVQYQAQPRKAQGSLIDYTMAYKHLTSLLKSE